MLTIRTRNVNKKRAENANRKVPSMLSTMTYEVTPLQSKNDNRLELGMRREMSPPSMKLF